MTRPWADLIRRRLAFFDTFPAALGASLFLTVLFFILEKCATPFGGFPVPILGLIAVFPALYFALQRRRWAPFSVKKLTLAGSALVLAFLGFVVLLPSPSPNGECTHTIGSGTWKGEKAVAVYCVTWFHEYEEYVEVYPADWYLRPGKFRDNRAAHFGPDAFGAKRDPSSESLRFDPPLDSVEFKGEALIVKMRDGSSKVVTPDPG